MDAVHARTAEISMPGRTAVPSIEKKLPPRAQEKAFREAPFRMKGSSPATVSRKIHGFRFRRLTFLKAVYIRISRYRVISKAGMIWDTFSKFSTNACAGAKHQSHRSFSMPDQLRQKARATSAGFFIFVHQFLSDIGASTHPGIRAAQRKYKTRRFKKDIA